MRGYHKNPVFMVYRTQTLERYEANSQIHLGNSVNVVRAHRSRTLISVKSETLLSPALMLDCQLSTFALTALSLKPVS